LAQLAARPDYVGDGAPVAHPVAEVLVEALVVLLGSTDTVTIVPTTQ
jgi:hypothetical protein